MKFLVFGGTVFLSRRVAEIALSRGHDVTVAARGVNGTPPAGARFVRIDRDTGAGLTALAGERFDAVVDQARLPGQVSSAIDMLGEGVRHWSFISTISVYADTATPGQTAGAKRVAPSRPDSTDSAPEAYAANKVACEDIVLQRLGERAFIVRPGLVAGPHDPADRFGYWPLRLADEGPVLAPGTPEDPIQYIDVSDLASWIVRAAETGVCGALDAVCPPQPRGDFLTTIAGVLSVSPDLVWVPDGFLLEQGIRPWKGEESLGLWVLVRDYAGFMSRDVAASLGAGMTIRPLSETVRDWKAAAGDNPPLLAKLSRRRERAVLEAWKDRQS